MTIDGTAPVGPAVPVAGVYQSSPSTLASAEHQTLRLTAAGLLRVASEVTGATAGDVAHDAADSGNPIKIGGKGSAAVATAVTEGDRVNASFSLEGRLRTIPDGTVAHDAADSGNPLKVGGIGRAIWETAASTAADRVNASFDLYGRQRVIVGQEAVSWSVVHNAGANTQATASKSAGGATERHVCKGFMFCFASLGAPTPEQLGVVIRDGATGAGTIIWQGMISLPAVAGESKWIGMSGLYLVGTAATAMTAEFSAAGGANDYQTVSLFGETIAA